MACSSNCPTPGAHASFGECLRAKNLRITGCGVGGSDTTAQKRWDAELQLYRDTRAQGIQPQSTRTKDIRQAVEISNVTGKPFQAGL